MSKFCGKCGSVMTPEGLCPNCDAGMNQQYGQMPDDVGRTVYAQNLGDYDVDSANIPQNQPPVTYEGSGPMNTPPQPPRQQYQHNSHSNNPRPMKPRKKINWGILLVCIILVLCLLTGGVTTMMYKGVIYIPNASEKLQLALDNKIYGEERNYFIITGDSITEKKIKDENSALEAAESFTKELGYESVAEEYYLLEDPFNVADYTYYRFQECYDGYPIIGRTMTIIADKDGKSCGVSTNVINIDNNFSTDIKDFEKDDVIESLKGFEKQGIEVNVNAYTKSIYSFDHCEKPLMTYEVLAVVNNVNFRLFIDPDEGKIINGYCLDSTASAVELQGNGKDMPGNPQHFNGDLHGTTFVMVDPERNISVYNSEKGSASMAVEYFDSDMKSYYNRRYNPGNASYTPNDEVCVIYDDQGEYYEYDKNTEKFIKDDIKLDLDDLTEEGYTVFNINSNKHLNPVSSDKKEIKDSLAVRLMVKTSHTYDFFKNILGREGYDGKKGTLLAVCNDYLNKQSEKAFSAGDNDGFSMISFGYDNPMDWDDVAHEYTHSMEQSISGLFYQSESGAIMEAYSDVFGELVEDYCVETMTGKKLEAKNLNGECDWQSEDRFLAMPLMNEMPSAYQDTYYKDKPSDEEWQTSNLGINNDFGEVHKNSTVISHIAYLLTNNDDEKLELSMEELANLWYRTLFILPSDCTFSAFRDCMELTADKMVASKELTKEQKKYLSDCFDRANIASTRYSNELSVVVRTEDPKKKIKVKIEGKEFKLLKFKDYSKEFILTDGEKLDKNLFEAVEELELKDGRYKIKAVDEDDKVNYFEREIVIYSDGKFPEYNNENAAAVYFFEKPKEIKMPEPTAAKEAAAQLPTDVVPDADSK